MDGDTETSLKFVPNVQLDEFRLFEMEEDLLQVAPLIFTQVGRFPAGFRARIHKAKPHNVISLIIFEGVAPQQRTRQVLTFSQLVLKEGKNNSTLHASFYVVTFYVVVILTTVLSR